MNHTAGSSLPLSFYAQVWIIGGSYVLCMILLAFVLYFVVLGYSLNMSLAPDEDMFIVLLYRWFMMRFCCCCNKCRKWIKKDLKHLKIREKPLPPEPKEVSQNVPTSTPGPKSTASTPAVDGLSNLKEM